MEFKINEYQLPGPITFNFEELKQEMTEKVSFYETLVYTDEQIQEAKKDKANLNKLRKALNDERIRMEKEYLAPFNTFKAQVNEIIGIIDKPVAVIDKQVKAYEEKQKQEKLEKIQEYYNSIEKPAFQWLGLPAIYNEKWLNASVSMKSIQEEITSRLEQIENDLATLQNLPEFGFEATEIYKSTLDLNRALNEGRRLAEIAKAKAEREAAMRKIEEERKAQAEEQARLAAETETHPTSAIGQAISSIEKQAFEGSMNPQEFPVIPPLPMWVAFKALMTTEQAKELKKFFEERNIEFRPV